MSMGIVNKMLNIKKTNNLRTTTGEEKSTENVGMVLSGF